MAPFGHQEPIGRDAEGSVMMKAAPTSSFVVAQSEFLFKFFVITFFPPSARAGQVDLPVPSMPAEFLPRGSPRAAGAA
jgi:hypothetical protein